MSIPLDKLAEGLRKVGIEHAYGSEDLLILELGDGLQHQWDGKSELPALAFALLDVLRRLYLELCEDHRVNGQHWSAERLTAFRQLRLYLNEPLINMTTEYMAEALLFAVDAGLIGERG